MTTSLPTLPDFDPTHHLQQLQEGCRALGIPLDPTQLAQFELFYRELVEWNDRFNLTAITSYTEVQTKHFLDSLAVLPEVEGAATLLDLGAGAGFPGIPLKLARPELEVVLVDAVGKKVAFMKHALVRLGLVKGGRALHVRAEGSPDREGLARAERVICRAFMDVPDWLALARHYVAPEGRAVAMLGKAPSEAELQTAAQDHGFTLQSIRHYNLPWSGAERAVAVFAPVG